MTATNFEPSYLNLLQNGELAERADLANQRMRDCDLCARYCHINRVESAKGAVCRIGERAIVYSYGPHHGEESVLRGCNGSGTIFFSGCNLRCVFCQNWDISQKVHGKETTVEEIAATMLYLQSLGCHNINFVSPSHVVAQIITAVHIAARHGLRLPLVYNSGGYDSPEALQLLDGIIDIYMPDVKYGDTVLARRYSKARNYVEVNFAAVKEMHRQVGDLVIDDKGIAQRGLLVRHLVLPNDIAGTPAVVQFLAEQISTHTYVNIMDQYHPCYRANEYPLLNRNIKQQEYVNALSAAHNVGLRRLDR